MGKSKEELLAKLSECVVEMEEDEVVEVAQEYIDGGYPAFDGIMDGLVDGMNKVSDLYDAEEYLNRSYLSMYIEWWLHNIGYYITKPLADISKIKELNERFKHVDLGEWD